MEAEMKGQERVCSSLVKHILVLLPKGNVGRTIVWTFLKQGWEKNKQQQKKENDLSFNSVLANSYKVLVSFPLSSSPWKFAVKKDREHFHPTMAMTAGLSFGKGAWEPAFFTCSCDQV